MTVRGRLIFLLLSFAVLLTIGRCVSDDFSFILNQFWFTSGFFLLLLLSLVDQPHFSKDANIFVNATTAWVSLLLIESAFRDGVWWFFFLGSSYLIISSYVLMLLRSSNLNQENPIVQLISRLNRQIGRPEALFSAFFLWGCLQQFGDNSTKISTLFLFWAVFIILNLPAIATAIENYFIRFTKQAPDSIGTINHILSPRIAEASLSADMPSDLLGAKVQIETSDGRSIGSAVLIDDRAVTGKRIGRLAITEKKEGWRSISLGSGSNVSLKLASPIGLSEDGVPISVVDSGSDISKLVFHVHPDQSLESGEVLWVPHSTSSKYFYQIIAASVCQSALPEGNEMHTVKVTAGQLGLWDNKRCRFEPATWVASAGQLVHRAPPSLGKGHTIPGGQEPVGRIPNSSFPVHVSVQDIVTHNTAIIGVTGSGKSYLAFHLIEAMARNGIKVLILDISRQHDIYLTQHSPVPLRTPGEVKDWLESPAPIGIHQFALDSDGYPKVTADFVHAAFNEISKTPLRRGENIPARLCCVFEEAHSLIPEWNQVARQGDEREVNRTARTILQGRKFGMGALIITQRTANVTKTILNQCNTMFALQSFDQTGLDFLRNYMGEEYAHAISTLPTRHAVLVGKASSSTRPLLFSVVDMSTRWTDLPDDTPGGEDEINTVVS